MNKFILLLLLTILIILTACNLTTQDPAIVVQNYLNALVKKDPATMVSLSCKERESEVQKELDSFMNVGTSIEGLNCSLKSQSSTNSSVVCQGYILMMLKYKKLI